MNPRTLVVICTGVLLAGGGALLLLSPEQAEAGFTSESTKELVEYAGSGASMNLRLVALETLRTKDESGIEAELAGLAKGSDKRLAIYACTALGKRGGTASKDALKALFESGSTATLVRKSAMTAIAVHFKDADDLSYFDLKTTGDSELRAHYLFLKSKIYRR